MRTPTTVESAGANITIDGQGSIALTGNWKFIMVQSTGGTWIIIGQN